MFDRDSLIISYDEKRGEPRGSRARNADPAGLELGSCIDCRKCVNVCPTGIDIRDGLQYQCIGCAACVDACSEVMETMGYGDSLVRYSSENLDENQKSQLIRPRLVGYAGLIVALIFAFSYMVASRIPLDLDIARDRNRLFRESWDGSIENVYTLQISNRESFAREYAISFESELPLQYIGHRSVRVEGGATEPVHVSLLLKGDAKIVEEPAPILFSVSSKGESVFRVEKKSPFRIPENRGATE